MPTFFFLSHTLRDTGFTNFSLYAELNKPGAIYAYAATQQNAPNITLGIGWPPAVEVRSHTQPLAPVIQASRSPPASHSHLGIPPIESTWIQNIIDAYLHLLSTVS